MSSCVSQSPAFSVLMTHEVAYGSSISTWIIVWCSELGRSAVCNASPSLLVSVIVLSGQEASSFRHVLGLSTSGAEIPRFYALPVLHGNAPLVLYSMLRSI
jgi:hypothetical protein